ncbi:hypothetical protein HDU97_007580 [Phlyctochytrium planicorne]|nr:hypothetical protein HDU97_007580 [Phlyctochytrium planicorne]
MDLPSNGLPPTYSDRAGSISYYFKVILSYQEGMKLLKTHRELEIPVIIRMPESTRIHLLTSPSPIEHNPPPAPDKCGYSIYIPHRSLQPGDTLEADVKVFSAPQNAIVRSVSASVRTSIEYIGQDCSATVSLAKPLAEEAEVVGGSVLNNAWANKFLLRLEPSVWRSSFESTLITIKSYFYLEIFLKGSDVANIAVEVPIVLVPPMKKESKLSNLSQLSRGSFSSDPAATPPNALGASPSFGSIPPSPQMMGMNNPSAPGSVVSYASNNSNPPPPPSNMLPPPAHEFQQQQQQQQQALLQMYQMQLALQMQQNQQNQQQNQQQQQVEAWNASVARSVSDRLPGAPGNSAQLRRTATNAAGVPFNYPQYQNGNPMAAQQQQMPQQQQAYGSPSNVNGWDANPPPRRPGGSISDAPILTRTSSAAGGGYGGRLYGHDEWPASPAPTTISSVPSSIEMTNMTAEAMLEQLVKTPAVVFDPRLQQPYAPPMPMAPQSIPPPERRLSRLGSYSEAGSAGTAVNDAKLQNLLTRLAPAEGLPSAASNHSSASGGTTMAGSSSASIASKTTGVSSAMEKMDALLNALSAMTDEAPTNNNNRTGASPIPSSHRSSTLMGTPQQQPQQFAQALPNLPLLNQELPTPPSSPSPALLQQQQQQQAGFPSTPSAAAAAAVAAAAAAGGLPGGPPSMPLPSPPGTTPTGSPIQTRRTIKEPKRYRVIAEYIPQLDDELELYPGQVMIIRKIYGDGWASGLNLSTGREGTFPLQNIEAM